MSVSSPMMPVLAWLSIVAGTCLLNFVSVKGEGHRQDFQPTNRFGIHSSRSPLKSSPELLAFLEKAILRSMVPVESSSKDFDAHSKEEKVMFAGPQQFGSVEENLDPTEIGENRQGLGKASDGKPCRPDLVEDGSILLDLAIERLGKDLMRGAENGDGKNWEKKRQSFRPWHGRKRSDGNVDETKTNQPRYLEAPSELSEKSREVETKRNDEEIVEGSAAYKIDEKRPGFSPWQGKRDITNKRSHFHPWYGKRSIPRNPQNTRKDLQNGLRKISSLGQVMNSDSSKIYGNYRTGPHLFHTHLSPSRSDPERIGDYGDLLFFLGGVETLADEGGHSQSSIHENNVRDEDNVEHSHIAKRLPFSPWIGKRIDNGLVSAKGSVLDNIEFEGKTLRSAMKSQERQNILTALRKLYRQITEGNSNENDASDEISDNQDEISVDQDPKDEKEAKGGKNKGYYVKLHRKRPAFHSWAGKRGVVHRVPRHKRSSNGSKTATSKTQGIEDSQDPVLQNNVSKDDTSNSTSLNKTGESDEESDLGNYRLHGKSSISKQKVESNVQKRRGFSAWHGKRNSLQDGGMNIKNSKDGLKQDTGVKRTMGFNTWHGKRNYHRDIINTDIANHEALGLEGKEGLKSEKNVKKSRAFSAWHGKRALNENLSSQRTVLIPEKINSHKQVQKASATSFEKRPAFSSWHGKRTLDSKYKSQIAASRTQFPEITDIISYTERTPSSGSFQEPPVTKLEKRPAFSAWHGKRADTEQSSQSSSAILSRETTDQGGSRRHLQDYSHSIKPSLKLTKAGDASFSNNGKDMATPVMVMEKRASFSAWHGRKKKRAKNKLEMPTIKFMKRPAFHAWSGKKRQYDSNFETQEVFKRPAFNAWYGKKRSQLSWTNFKAPPPLMKRPQFHAWYGKKRKRGEPATFLFLPANAETTKTWSLDPLAAPNFSSTISGSNPQPTHSQHWVLQDSNLLHARSTVARQPYPWGSHQKTSLGVQNFSKRPAFHAWSGKKRFRDSLSHISSPFLPPTPQHLVTIGQAQVSSTPVKRPAFHAWNGKRNGNPIGTEGKQQTGSNT